MRDGVPQPSTCPSQPPRRRHRGPLLLVQTPIHPDLASSQADLNPDAATFSPTLVPSGGDGEDLLDWLLFSPSSSEARSSAFGLMLGASLSGLFAYMVHGKGKALMELEAAPSALSSSHGVVDVSSFMANVHRSASLISPSPPAQSGEEGEWQIVIHRRQWRRVLKVHLGPYLISVSENNPNKNLIISMSIKQEFRQQKEEKEKDTPKFVSIQMKGL
jgi:hypothetical protein